MKKGAMILSITVFGLFLISQTSFAQVYKWVDEKGTVNFTDDPNKVPVKYRTKSETLDMNPKESPPPTLSVRPDTKSSSDLSETIQMLDKMIKSGKTFKEPSASSQSEAEPVNKPSPGYIPFDKFKYLQEGMTEAEVLSRFGEPTRVVEDEARVSGGAMSGIVNPGGTMTGTFSGRRIEVIKRYYYIGDKSKGEKTTIIHFRRGRVLKYERI